MEKFWRYNKKETMEFPKVEVKASFYRGSWSLIMECCPYCGEEHLHGGGKGEEPMYGHRVSHCINPSKGYEKGYELIPEKGDHRGRNSG